MLPDATPLKNPTDAAPPQNAPHATSRQNLPDATPPQDPPDATPAKPPSDATPPGNPPDATGSHPVSPPGPLPPRFDPAVVETESRARWESARAFETEVDPDGSVRPDGDPSKEPYTIVIPPPNVTGRLHMGHALNNTIQDVLIRYQRMNGRDALWVPGTDHAGISTQTVVRKHLDAKGVDYRALGRDRFIAEVWKWREEYGGVILDQLKRLGCSCDFRRTRFTMDEGLSRAVRTVFKALYDRGLIYRGKRVVNWCPVDRTALSDDEVETAADGEPGEIWHIAYPLADDSGDRLVVATTRPETMFGDAAVAVHPDDPRYQRFVSRQVRLPLTGRTIPVIADAGVERDFGTGCLKITPAHDPHDFEIGERHRLAPRNVMNEDASLNENAPKAFRGMDRYRARAAAVEALREAGLLEAVVPHRVPLGRAQRSGAPIEYRLSDQWFVRMRPLADRALRRSGYEQRDSGWVKEREGELRFHPKRWEQVYARWLIGIRDWTISRQIWWGHRIPAWRHRETGEIVVGVDPPEAVLRDPEAWRPEEDVLDTWFSSWLWPMSTLGWPGRTPDFERHFPTTTLSTDKGILFFWVARMNFASLEMTGRLPYRDVYIHPTVLDERGAVMSKSKGNGIDPLAVMDGATLAELRRPLEEARPSDMAEIARRLERSFPKGFDGVGADALRFTLVRLCSEGQEMRLSLPKFHEIGRRFITKLWNASRFTLLALAETAADGEPAPPTVEDRWIRSRLAVCADEAARALDAFDFSTVGASLYRFVWNDFCDWYVELAKARMRLDQAAARTTAATLAAVLGDVLHLLHPVAPFVTEFLHARLGDALAARGLDGAGKRRLLARSPFPGGSGDTDTELEERFDTARRLVVSVRQLRADAGLRPDLPVRLAVRGRRGSERLAGLLAEGEGPFRAVGRLESLEVMTDDRPWPPAGWIGIVDPACEAAASLPRDVDLGAVRSRVASERERVENRIRSSRRRLGNPNFVERADPAVVREHRERLASLVDQERQLRDLARSLTGENVEAG